MLLALNPGLNEDEDLSNIVNYWQYSDRTIDLSTHLKKNNILTFSYRSISVTFNSDTFEFVKN